MTEKQERILEVALEMFADKGFDATSTSKVARQAGVSEGLIFRHFGNKEGLLEAIMQQGRERVEAVYATILTKTSSKDILKSILEAPFTIQKDQFHFWKLLYSLKWQSDVYDSSLSAPMREVLTRVFTDLGYHDAEAEADVVMLLLDGVATAVLLRKPDNTDAIRKAILAKYDLN